MKNLTLGHVVTRNADDDVDAVILYLFRLESLTTTLSSSELILRSHWTGYSFIQRQQTLTRLSTKETSLITNIPLSFLLLLLLEPMFSVTVSKTNNRKKMDASASHSNYDNVKGISISYSHQILSITCSELSHMLLHISVPISLWRI